MGRFSSGGKELLLLLRIILVLSAGVKANVGHHGIAEPRLQTKKAFRLQELKEAAQVPERAVLHINAGARRPAGTDVLRIQVAAFDGCSNTVTPGAFLDGLEERVDAELVHRSHLCLLLDLSQPFCLQKLLLGSSFLIFGRSLLSFLLSNLLNGCLIDLNICPKGSLLLRTAARWRRNITDVEW